MSKRTKRFEHEAARGESFLVGLALGVVGSLGSGFLFSAFGSSGVTGLNLWSLFVSVSGAVVALALYQAVASGHQELAVRHIH